MEGLAGSVRPLFQGFGQGLVYVWIIFAAAGLPIAVYCAFQKTASPLLKRLSIAALLVFILFAIIYVCRIALDIRASNRTLVFSRGIIMEFVAWVIAPLLLPILPWFYILKRNFGNIKIGS